MLQIKTEADMKGIYNKSSKQKKNSGLNDESVKQSYILSVKNMFNSIKRWIELYKAIYMYKVR